MGVHTHSHSVRHTRTPRLNLGEGVHHGLALGGGVLDLGLDHLAVLAKDGESGTSLTLGHTAEGGNLTDAHGHLTEGSQHRRTAVSHGNLVLVGGGSLGSVLAVKSLNALGSVLGHLGGELGGDNGGIELTISHSITLSGVWDFPFPFVIRLYHTLWGLSRGFLHRRKIFFGEVSPVGGS